MAYPTTLDTVTPTTGTNLLTSPDHANLHNTLGGSSVVAIETFLGTSGASNGIFNAYTAGQLPLAEKGGTLQKSIFGTINNSIMGTPAITGGTFNNGVFGSATLQSPTMNGQGTNSGTITGGMYGTVLIQGGTANNQVLGTPAITSGTINNATLGTPTLQIPYRVRAYMAGANTLASGADTIIPLDTITYDSNSNFGTAAHTYIVPVTGYYQINGAVGFADNTLVSGKRIAASIYYNGAALDSSIYYAAGPAGMNASVASIEKLTVGGTLALYGFQETGGAISMLNLSKYTYLAVHLLSV